ncbi:gliding motility-associated ABC transporter permease subunit GldF [Lutimonas sp.]|jgi:ABC-2 type transport system permease protein|uniref:gliding motility-associated ABC transporter permease subunit GldF n=1 Tax=Lutimonas sp. TaxID=1872403 RepID=UPI003C770E9E
MLAILKKELNIFFATPIGYLVIAIFLLINGLFLWVFKGDFNILDANFADLNSFFFIAPWFFIFVIPAITMRTFSDEIRLGTIEIIKTKPISTWDIIIGKYLGCLLLISIALVPTMTYVYTITQLAATPENIDYGSIIGSYAGLLFLASSITSIGMFASTLSNNQIVAFITGLALSFFMFYGFEAIDELVNSESYAIKNIGLYAHFINIGRGVIDTKDLLYFISVTFFFLFITKTNFDHKQ